MGKNWKEAVTKIHAYGSKDKIDAPTVNSLVAAYKQEEKDISLELTDTSNYLVELVAKEDRASVIEKMLQEKKVVSTSYVMECQHYFVPRHCSI